LESVLPRTFHGGQVKQIEVIGQRKKQPPVRASRERWRLLAVMKIIPFPAGNALEAFPLPYPGSFDSFLGCYWDRGFWSLGLAR
jgi:hypothetical protein